jgi:hypothetical protein
MQEEDGCDEGDGEDDDDVGVTIAQIKLSHLFCIRSDLRFADIGLGPSRDSHLTRTMPSTPL